MSEGLVFGCDQASHYRTEAGVLFCSYMGVVGHFCSLECGVPSQISYIGTVSIYSRVVALKKRQLSSLTTILINESIESPFALPLVFALSMTRPIASSSIKSPGKPQLNSFPNGLEVS